MTVSPLNQPPLAPREQMLPDSSGTTGFQPVIQSRQVEGLSYLLFPGCLSSTCAAHRWHAVLLLWTLTTIVALTPTVARACTTAVISGRATIDGRPLLWKNRDYWQRNNELVRDDSGEIPFVGVVNAEASLGIRMGVNTAGVCIENSTSRDLTGVQDDGGPNNGQLIRMGLQTCRSVSDFKALLEATNQSGRRTRGNFGVIDASGGAMMFEVGPTYFTAFDANDPQDAPNGIIVRSNFAKTAGDDPGEDANKFESAYSYDRYSRAKQLCDLQVESGGIDVPYLLRQVCRDIGVNTQTESHAISASKANSDSSDVELPEVIDTAKLLNRGNTVSAAVFQGVMPGEAASLTTMWVMLGEPLFAIAVPCWANQPSVSPLTNGQGSSELCNASLALRAHYYRPETTQLQTDKLPGLQEKIHRTENNLFAVVAKQQAKWLQATPSPSEQLSLHEDAVNHAFHFMKSLVADQGRSRFASETLTSTVTTASPESIDYQFEDDNGTKLGSVKNSAGDDTWSGGITDGRTFNGSFRINRNRTEGVMRYLPISPQVRTRGDDASPSGYLVVKVAGWNLRGKTINEEVRFGFSSQAHKNIQTVGMLFKRMSSEEVVLSGVAFGDGGTGIEQTATFPAEHAGPLTLVLELNKVEANPDEGDSGGTYRIHYREGDTGPFESLGETGKVRRLRNGNQVHVRTAGFFAASDEYFDIDRIFFTTDRPLD